MTLTDPATGSSPSNSFTTKQVFGKAAARSKKKIICHCFQSFPISYCKSGRQDTVYCGKIDKREKTYQSKHFLLLAIKEIVALFNKEHGFIVTYYSLQ